MKFRLLFSFLTVILLYSCQSVPKDVAYFQDLDAQTQQRISQIDFSKYEATIQNNDVLLITVASPTLNQDVVAQFNLPMANYLTPGESSVQASPAMQTYLVDKDGYISYPVIGKIKLGGLAFSEAVKTMEKAVSDYVTNPIINMEIISFQVTVMGEVFKPGPVEAVNGRISILDALGAAGDLTIWGDRRNVLLIRDNNGKKEFVRFDLTKSEVFASPYFYLQQNDLVVVEPNDARKKESKYGQTDSYRLSIVSTIIGSISAVTTIILAINSLK